MQHNIAVDLQGTDHLRGQPMLKLGNLLVIVHNQKVRVVAHNAQTKGVADTEPAEGGKGTISWSSTKERKRNPSKELISEPIHSLNIRQIVPYMLITVTQLSRDPHLFRCRSSFCHPAYVRLFSTMVSSRNLNLGFMCSTTLSPSPFRFTANCFFWPL